MRVVATDLEHPDDAEGVEIMNNYVLICAGSCERTDVQVWNKADGTQTHVITVKGIRRAAS